MKVSKPYDRMLGVVWLLILGNLLKIVKVPFRVTTNQQF